MELEIFLNGLIPITRDKKGENDVGGSRVYIKITKGDLHDFEKIVNADDKGEVSFTESEAYAGGNILIRIANRHYKTLNITRRVEKHGLFFTAKTEHDYTFWSQSDSLDPEWNSQEEYDKADEIRVHKLRQFRYKNGNAKILYFLFILLSLTISALVPGGFGIGIGIIIVIILEFISTYSMGLKKLVTKRRK